MRHYVGPCQEWPGAKHRQGYGVLKRRGRWMYAHRAAWIDAHGPIPEGLDVLHACDNPPCRNVEHLFLGTHAENMADRNAKGRQARGERMGGAKLSEAQVFAIRVDDRAQSVIGADYGVSPETISNIKTGRTWGWLTERREYVTTIAPPPPKAPTINYATAVVRFGEALYGKNWASDLGRLTGINPRTLSRILAAHHAGREYRAARGVIRALDRSLQPIAASLVPWADRAAEETEDG